MEPHKSYGQEQYSPMTVRNAALGSGNSRFLQDPSSSINANVRPPDFHNPAARPVLNYSIQTGEEFALEFMRERMTPRQQLIPNTYGDSNAATNYTGLEGLLGITHAGSESGSDVSMISSMDRGHAQEYEKKNIHSMPQISPGTAGNQGSHVCGSLGVSDTSSRKIKFLCSFGGKMLPRPSDGKLRYIGGETHIIQLSRDISWQELVQKTSMIHNLDHSIKYQLPGEDLDALVSVSSDEDLRNMMEEYEILEDGRSQKLRMFLFSGSDLDDSRLGLDDVEGDYEIQYVLAVNGMYPGSRKSSIVVGSTSGNNLDELLNLNVGTVMGRVENELAGVLPVPSTAHMPSSNVALQSVPLTSFHVCESDSLAYKGQMVDHGKARLETSSTVNSIESFHNVDGKNTDSSSVQLQWDYISDGSKFAPRLEGPAPLQINLTDQEGVNQEQPPSFTDVQNPQGRPKRDSMVVKTSDSENNQSLTREVQEEKMKRDSPFRKRNEPGKFLNQEEAVSCVQDGTVLKCVPRMVPDVNFAGDAETPFLHAQYYRKHEESMRTIMTHEVSQEGNRDKYEEDELAYSSGKPAPGYGDFRVEPEEFNNFESPILAQRVFHSERIPREPAEQKRLSKSNDRLDPQVLISRTHPNLLLQMTEIVDNSCDGNLTSMTDQSVLTKNTVHANPQIVRNGPNLVRRYDKASEDADKMDFINGVEAVEPKSTSCVLKSAVALQDGHKMGPGTPSKIPENSAIGSLHNSGIISDKNNANNTKEHLQNSFLEEEPLDASLREPLHVGIPGQSDILIDINDRFPPDFLSDFFSKARISHDLVGPSELHNGETGLSLNIQNHEPKCWSFFQKLAEDDFGRKDVSIIDQDHLGFSSSLTNTKGAPMDYSYPPLKTEEFDLAHIDSNANNEAIQLQSSGAVGVNIMDMHSDFVPSCINFGESIQIDGLVDPRILESDNEDGKLETRHADSGTPLVDLPRGEFHISTLQIIENEDLEELRELGSGTFGTVYHGKWRGTDVAIKRFKKSCSTGRSSEQERLKVEFWSEADILSKLHHPNVVAFYGVVQDGPGGTLATVTEYMVNGSLRHVIVSKDRHLDCRKRLIIAMDAAFGMEYLHSKNIVHFDLKCDNLLVNLKDPLRPICKVGDFGLSKIKRNTLVTGGVRGTLPWMAPELLSGNSSKVSEKVDVFSFGIVLWEILTGEEPYADMHYGAIIGGIANNTLRPHVPSYCDPEWRLLMEQCWAPDPVARPSFAEIARRLGVMSSSCQSKPQGHQARNQVSK